ncbi:MAG TPA: hypothetical protein VIC25_09330 [Caulobacteraceae bacterium]|jgi:hypothetical protein
MIPARKLLVLACIGLGLGATACHKTAPATDQNAAMAVAPSADNSMAADNTAAMNDTGSNTASPGAQ